jgi:hypothetical protein
LVGSVWVFTQPPLHSVVPGLQVHVAAMQVAPAVHAFPHAPQLAGSVWVSTHAELQLVSVPGQAAVQSPLLHTWLAPHAMPHAPQFLGSFNVAAQVPPQFTSVKGQVHWPLVQPRPLHAVVHWPQWFGSD